MNEHRAKSIEKERNESRESARGKGIISLPLTTCDLRSHGIYFSKEEI
jgi:hypothetical protein